ncbi:MAG: hypothetical protein EPN33_13000 [Acidobacteria bacterium]|nr:MAG: hypothetical protein EPN33_13000 [Acidobacteriota bacterium]
MATRTQLQLEPLSGCIHEQFLQSEYERQRRRIYTLCRWMLSDANRARRMEINIFLDACRGADSGHGLREEIMDGERLVAHFAVHFRGLFASDAAAAGGGGAAPPSGLRLREAVRQLPAGQRLLYLLHELEGYPPAVLADWLDLDPGYCARLIHEARLQLRDAVAA